MPELPEVEIVSRGLRPVLVGARIMSVEQRRPDLRFPFPDRFAERLQGRAIVSVERRAKYLLITVDDDAILIVHLGMSGRLVIASGSQAKVLGEYVYSSGADPTHDHVALTLSSGHRIFYNDPRRFGFMLLSSRAALPAHPLFVNLGVEPLGCDFTPAVLAEKARGRRVDLKSLLLDQRVVSGLGNIYVSEALHAAALSPRRAAASLALANGRPAQRAIDLVPAIKSVLAAAIEAGGSSLRDYRQADGSSGGFQERFTVYGREGATCARPGCSGTVTKVVQAQRASFFCRSCQR